MLNTSSGATGATLHPTPTTSNDGSEARAIAALIARSTRAEPRAARSLWGPHCRGLVGPFFARDGAFVLNRSIRLIRNPRGVVTGFDVDGLRCDYAALAATVEAARRDGLALLLTGPNANLGRRVAASAEERLARAIAETRLRDGVAEALCEMGIEATTVPLRAATRLATGIVGEALAGAVPGSRTGPLNLARAFPPSLRRSLAVPLLTGLQADQVRDLLLQLPIAALVPGELASNAGLSPKRILDRLGLPREARNVLPRALAPIAKWLRHEHRALGGDDLRWLTGELCASLPDRSLEQLHLLDLALRLRLGGADDAGTAARAIWAARNRDALALLRLRDWMLAEPSLLERLALPAWHPKISLGGAEAATEAFAEALAAMADPERGAPFSLPAWAVPRVLPDSRWRMVPMTDEVALAAEGRRMGNCLGSYGARCRAGTVILSIRRAERANESERLPRAGGGWVIGANAELVRFAGAWQLVQLKGPRNAEAPSSIRAAVMRLLDGINH